MSRDLDLLPWRPVVRRSRVGWGYGVESRGGFVSHDGWMPTRRLAAFMADWTAFRQATFVDRVGADRGWEPASDGAEPTSAGEPSGTRRSTHETRPAVQWVLIHAGEVFIAVCAVALTLWVFHGILTLGQGQ